MILMSAPIVLTSFLLSIVIYCSAVTAQCIHFVYVLGVETAVNLDDVMVVDEIFDFGHYLGVGVVGREFVSLLPYGSA